MLLRDRKSCFFHEYENCLRCQSKLNSHEMKSYNCNVFVFEIKMRFDTPIFSRFSILELCELLVYDITCSCNFILTSVVRKYVIWIMTLLSLAVKYNSLIKIERIGEIF